MLASAATKSAPARASAAQSSSVIAASARHGSTNSSLHQPQQLVHLMPRALPEVAEPDVVGAGFARSHRRIARAAAGHAEDPLAAQRRARAGTSAAPSPKMDTVGADLKGEPDMVAHQAGGAALRAHRAHGRKARAQAAARAERRGRPTARSRRRRRPRAPPRAARRDAPGRSSAGRSAGAGSPPGRAAGSPACSSASAHASLR